jgi:polyisoprenoid-binding protein YceI
MKKLFVLLTILFITNSSFTQERNTITKSVIAFQIKNLGVNTGGTISGLKADIQFNPTDLASGSIEASVDANTINTDNDGRDDHLKSEDYFNAAQFPKIVMKSVSFKHKSGVNYTGSFNLTIKGKTKLIEIPFTYTENGNMAIFKSNFKLNRLDFGIGESSMILSSEVNINIDAEIGK